MSRAALYRRLLGLYKETVKAINALDPGAQVLVLSDQVCDMNKDYCDQAASIIRKVYQEMQEIAREAKEKGLERLHERIIVFLEHDWGPDKTIYDPLDILRVAEALFEEDQG